MPAEPARPEPLRVVDPNGEIHECPSCAELSKQLAGAETEIRAWRQRFANLKRDREAEAQRDPLWPEALALFRYWQERCEHPLSQWSAKRFELVEPFLKREGGSECRKAIRGAAYEPFTTRRRNGSLNRHDAFELIFRSQDKFDDFRSRCPDVRFETEARAKGLVEHAGDVAKRVLERAKLIEKEKDPVAVAHLLLEIDRLNNDWRTA